MIYIVTYDLQEPGKRYGELLELIQSARTWARLGQSSYLIESSKTPVQLRDEFAVVLDGNDKLYVGQISSPAAWAGLSIDVSNWIKSKI